MKLHLNAILHNYATLDAKIYRIIKYPVWFLFVVVADWVLWHFFYWCQRLNAVLVHAKQVLYHWTTVLSPERKRKEGGKMRDRERERESFAVMGIKPRASHTTTYVLLQSYTPCFLLLYLYCISKQVSKTEANSSRPKERKKLYAKLQSSCNIHLLLPWYLTFLYTI